ncbi:MAG: M20/M25/M40 family metallo-hydrolase [Anaerolineae bacterium]|nr:M20/M25/M40 family metallo-hydrolase [Anaerolineae bacterium]
MIETIRKLVETYGPSGHEGQIRDVILREIEGLADEVSIDALGSIIAWKRSGKPDATTIMLSSHMDEIGMIVTHVDKEGFLRFANIGGLYPNTLLGNRVLFADGTIGTIGVDAEVSATSTPKLSQLFIDASNGKKHTVKVGDAAGLHRTLEVRGERLIAKSMDDRIGCAIQIEVMRTLKQCPHDVAFVFSVQEEVGLRGAQTAAYAVAPQFAIAIDVTRTGDTPNGYKMEVALGKGPAIKIKDSRMLASPEVITLMEKAAKAANVPYQREVLIQGSTDAASMQLVRAGVRAGCLSIPCRYVHTTSETVDRNDVKNAVQLLMKLLESPVKV